MVGAPLVLGLTMGNTDTQDSPRPELGGSHHLPLYSILCNSRRRWHPNGYISQDSRVGVSKLFRVGVLELWMPISPDFRVWSQRDLKQSCSSRRELFNVVSHSQIRHQEEVDSRLLVALPVWLPAFLLAITCVSDVQMSNVSHFRHLHSKSFPMVPRAQQSIEIWPFNSPFDISGVHRDSLSQNGSCLESVSVHSLTLPRTSLNSRECVVTLGLSLGPQPSNAFAFAPGLPSF
jgi:hypothetical protein